MIEDSTQTKNLMVFFPYNRLSDQMVEVRYPNIDKMWMSGRLEGEELFDMKLSVDEPNAVFQILLSHDEINQQIAEVYQPDIEIVWLTGRLKGERLLDIKLILDNVSPEEPQPQHQVDPNEAPPEPEDLKREQEVPPPLELDGAFKRAGIKKHGVSLGQRILQISLQDRNIDIELEGSNPNSQLGFWDLNEQLIREKLEKNGLSQVEDALIIYVLRKLIDRNKKKEGRTRLEPYVEGTDSSKLADDDGGGVCAHSFRWNDQRADLFFPQECEPLAKEIIGYVNVCLEQNKKSKLYRKPPLLKFLLDIVKGLIATKGNRLESAAICDAVCSSLQGWPIPEKPRSYYTVEYGEISRAEISAICYKVFGARKYGHHGKKVKLEFDLDKLDAVDMGCNGTYFANLAQRREHIAATKPVRTRSAIQAQAPAQALSISPVDKPELGISDTQVQVLSPADKHKPGTGCTCLHSSFFRAELQATSHYIPYMPGSTAVAKPVPGSVEARAQVLSPIDKPSCASTYSSFFGASLQTTSHNILYSLPPPNLANLEEDVRKGLEFLVSHFVGQGQAPGSSEKTWMPCRNILVINGSGQKKRFKVFADWEAFQVFAAYKFKDCMVNAYSHPSKYRTIPSLLFFDVDKSENLGPLLERIERVLGGHPTVLETSPGHFHIIQPIGVMSSTVLREVFAEDLAQFPRFVAQYIGDGVLTDPEHHPTLESMMLRVPFSINTKNAQNFQVRIVQKWDRELASVGNLEIPFAAYLARATLRQRTRWKGHTHRGQGYKWIDSALQKGFEHGRNILIWKVFAPYFINILKLSEDEAVDKIMDWLEICKVLRHTKIVLPSDYIPIIHDDSSKSNSTTSTKSFLSYHYRVYSCLLLINFILWLFTCCILC